MTAEQDPDEAENQLTPTSHVPATSGPMLLPRPFASLVSLLTQSTSLSLRIGSFFGGFAIDSARATTLTGLELSRAVIEGILTRAGRDVALRSGDDHGRAEAESLLERSLATLHTTVTSASFFAAATFHFSSTTLASVTNFSQALLSTLDAILGSTESSRAIAAIITLIRREFRSVDTGGRSEKIGVGDLLIGSVGFALLQRWGKRNTERLLRENGGDEIIWDTVILDNGARADVVGTHQLQLGNGDREEASEDPEGASFVMPGTNDQSFNAVQRRSSEDPSTGSRLSFPLDGQQQVSDEDVRSYIMSQLPPGCHASIKSEVLTARTITVDIFDDDMAEITAPPGTTMVEERFHHHDHASPRVPEHQRLPKHTVVFRTAFNKSQSTQLRPHDTSSREFEAGHHQRQRQRSLPGDLPLGTQPRIKLSRAQSQGSSSDATIKEDTPAVGHADPQSPKSAGGKGSFARFAQRVKPVGQEKPENAKRQPPKRPTVKVPSSVGAPANRPPVKPPRGTASVKEATARENTNRQSPIKRPSQAPDYRPSTPGPNRGLRRVPLPNSPQTHSPHSQNKHAPARGLHDRANSRAGHYVAHERSQESLLTHTDTFSRRATDFRPGSPATSRTHVRSSSSLSVSRSEADGPVSASEARPGSSSYHRRSQSYTPSMYSVATAGSETSLLLAHRPRKSAYEDMDTIQALNRDGMIPGIFPERHFVRNIRRFCRFSSASYGSSALKVMGVRKDAKDIPHTAADSHEHSAFEQNAGLPPSTILLSSFVDPAGGSNAAGETESGFPLVHYLSIDHESKAVVLTLRGTWGFEDILTDMTCDYDDLDWQGRNWKVHKGMHASAKRLLEGGGGRVMITLRAALEEFTEYGVVLCGHSLGGGVAALLATMIAEPSASPIGTSFVTAPYHPPPQPRLLSSTTTENTTEPSQPPHYDLPSGRPIHVYAYGPPAVMSPFLRLATRGLITTIVNSHDIVPTLSLGILHDMHTVSTLFKTDVHSAKSHIRARLHESLRQSIVHKFYVNQPPLVVNAGDGVGEDAWAWNTLALLRDEMRAPKLMPPGEVFVVETMRVLQREAFTAQPEFGADGYPRLGRPATRVQMRFIRDVDAWFGELRFASGMLSDHNPARYETGLAALARGVLDE